MDKLFAGGDFIWWMGVVEDSFDPLGLGRVKVRIVGHHNQDAGQLPTLGLPYASIIHSVDNPVSGGVGTTTMLPVGTRVFGFFIDGEVRSQPAVLGVLSGQHISSITNNTPPDNAHQQPNINPLLGTDIAHTEQNCPSAELDSNTTNTLKTDYRNLKINKGDFVYPATGYICDYYLARHGKHHGVDIAALGAQGDKGSPHLGGRYRGKVGTPIYAVADGTVQYIFRHSQGQRQVSTNYDVTGQGSRSYGNAIAIRHNLDGQVLMSIYAHMGSSQDAGSDADGSGISVSLGQSVTKGQQIGTMGRTHNFDTPTHCHFEMRTGTTLERGGLNCIPPWIIFPKMQCTHTSILSWVNSTIDYKTAPYISDKDLPMQALETPS